MKNDSPQKALLVVLAVAFVCSVMVSVAAVALKPIQMLNQLVERSRNVVALTGLVPAGTVLADDEILEAVKQLDIRVVNIDTGEFEPGIDAVDFDARAAASDNELGIAIPPADDVANLGRRSRYAVVYMVWDGEELTRVILPIHGQGMWSTIYGFLALEADLNTVAAVSFYEQAETAGLGDQILRPDWQAGWQGRRLFDSRGNLSFRVASGVVEEGSPAARHQVDGLSGATVTGDAVTRIVAYWFGQNGYGEFLRKLGSQSPTPALAERGQKS